LLSFAQFEREVIGERIRDKFAASRKRGMWMGGFIPMGYDVRDRKLVINEAEAQTVRMIFERFVALGSASTLARALQAERVLNKRGRRIDKGFLYKLLRNRVYLGEAVHKGTSYPGEHTAIITQDLWDGVQAILKDSPRERGAKNRIGADALLKGIIFAANGSAMTPTFTRKGERLYHYYVSMDLLRNRDIPDGSGPARLPAAMVEGTVVAEIRRLVATPDVVARVLEACRKGEDSIDERSIIETLQNFNGLWETLFPAEQSRIVRLLVDRVTVSANGLEVDLRNNGISMLARELTAGTALGAAE
jgi:hypothetical protein